MRQAIVELSDTIAKNMGIYETDEYKAARVKFLLEDLLPKQPVERLEEYELYLRLKERVETLTTK
jgi:hypothetical protein